MAFLVDIAIFCGTHWILISVSALAIHLVLNRYTYGISDIPGPFLASFSDAWLLIHYVRRKGTEEYNMHQKFNSPLLRLGPNTISVADSEALKVIYGWKPVWKKVCGKNYMRISELKLTFRDFRRGFTYLSM
jgi:hypothetical protein